MANKAVIDVEARFVDHVTSGAKGAERAIDALGKEAVQTQKEIDKLGKKPVKPLIDVDNNKFINKIRSMEAKMQKMGRTKTAAVLDLVDKGSTKLAKLINKAHAFGHKVWRGILEFNDSKALSVIRKVTHAAESLTKKAWQAVIKVKDMALAPIRAIKNALFSIPTLIKTIIAATVIKKVVADPIALADQYSSAKIGFTTLLGESEGQAMMDEIDLFAKKTPFKTSGVITNVQKMMAMGWDVERVIDDLETIGDAAAATGRGDEGLASITYALSEIRSKGKLSTQELNQLASAGIKAKAYLAQGLGYGTSDEGMKKLAEDLESGAIGANQAIDLILQGMEEFDGMMDRTANETVSGLKSQLEDVFEINIARRWGQGLQEGARRGIGSIVSLLDDAQDSLAEFGDMMYEIGSRAGNWFADKLEGVVKRIQDVTGSFEFKNANLGEKISMLWKGVVTDPLSEWWNGGGREKTARSAEKIGRWMGRTLSKVLLGIFGMTDVLKEGGIGESAGRGIAQSFAKGFVENFDVSAITKKFVEAISNVWGALPWWAKLFVGGKALSGLGYMIGGIRNLVGGAGFTATTGWLNKGLTSMGYWLTGKPGIVTSQTNMGASLTSLGALASLYVGYQGLRDLGQGLGYLFEGNTSKAKVPLVKSGLSLGGLGLGAWGGAKAGAAAGTLFGLPGTIVGGILGAAAGGLGGIFLGNKYERWQESKNWSHEGMKKAVKDGDDAKIQAEYEKALYEDAKEHFGDLKLTANEISRLAEQIVWGDSIKAFEKFSSATKSAEQNLQSMKSASEQADRWMWKAGLGVKFNEDETEAFRASIDEYINSAKSYVEDKHYEFAASAELLLDLESEEGKSILEGGNAFYAQIKGDLDSAGQELGKVMTDALADGIISADENAAIIAAQQKLASITEKIANMEAEAEMELVKVKWGGGNLDNESFDSFMEAMNSQIESRVSASDEAFTAQVTNLKLRLDSGAIDMAQYEAELQTLVDGYQAKVGEVQAEVMGVELQMIGSAYDVELEGEGVARLQNALEHCIKENIDPIDLSDKKLFSLLKVSELDGATKDNIKNMLSGVFKQMGALQIDDEVLVQFKNLNVDHEELLNMNLNATLADSEKIEILASDFGIPKEMMEEVVLNLTGIPNFLNKIDYIAEEFGITKEQAQTVLFKLTGEKSVLNRLPVSGKDFGVPEETSSEIIARIQGKKSIENKISVKGSELVKTTSVWTTITVNVKAALGKVIDSVTGTIQARFNRKYRGGVVGGSSSMGSFFRGGIAGYSDGGMVRGGSQLIEVAEEGSPEMIIPLSSQRRGRALKLWAQAGNIMGVPGFARGGLTNGAQDEGIRFQSYSSSESSTGSQPVQVDIGGLTFEINVNGTDGNSITEAIKAQASEIAETVAGVLADALGAQFENTPARGGVA